MLRPVLIPLALRAAASAVGGLWCRDRAVVSRWAPWPCASRAAGHAGWSRDRHVAVACLRGGEAVALWVEVVSPPGEAPRSRERDHRSDVACQKR